ncbi:gastrula zinc finger protein XlCGF62.1-like isoform X1 [Folsomia candida]|uniref:gastrula zinc finger protein XlCGF62.1-like isoform X1 n=1 Tax=Folsomia candida TaxID=158441 RepID=UPI0016050D15|nr:gastrula zinc finger protein XlCGF62.1-like isoform X1 [Folsomia candida]
MGGQENGWGCSTCSKTCTTKCNLKLHMLTHDPDAKVKCEICGKISKNPKLLSAHIRMLHTDRDRPSCDICHRLFSTDAKLRRHVNIVHSTTKRPRLPCGFPGCGKTYLNRHSVSYHIKADHSENPTRFPCTLCGKEFKIRRILEAHISTHTTEKTHICSTCGRGFRFGQLTVMKYHERTHPCLFCDKRFSTLGNMRRHVEARHPENKEKIHSCNECEYRTHSKLNLAQHARRHNPVNRRECYF